MKRIAVILSALLVLAVAGPATAGPIIDPGDLPEDRCELQYMLGIVNVQRCDAADDPVE